MTPELHALEAAFDEAAKVYRKAVTRLARSKTPANRAALAAADEAFETALSAYTRRRDQALAAGRRAGFEARQARAATPVQSDLFA